MAMDKFKLDDRVMVIGKNTKGKIAFIGETHFSEGEMYGVILDEPKGKYSGIIGDICYFDCPENHATFVRACQLQKDVRSSSKHRIAPMYPNYLKDSSSKHGSKIMTEHDSKIEIVESKIKSSVPEKYIHSENFEHEKDYGSFTDDLIASVDPNFFKHGSSKYGSQDTLNCASKPKLANLQKKPSKSSILDHSVENFNPSEQGKDDIIINKAGEIKNSFPKNLEVKLQNLGEALAELSSLKQKLAERNKKIEEVHVYLRKLKTYLKWSKHNQKVNSNGDCNIDNFFRLLVDSVLKQMEDVVVQISNKELSNSTEGLSAVDEENNFLRLYVDVLEKRNEVLTDSLTHARNILEQAWKRSCARKKCKCVKTSGAEVEIECKYCTSKRSSITDVLEQETRLFLESYPIDNVSSLEYTKKGVEEFVESEKINRCLESLLPKEGQIYTEKKVQNNLNREIANNSEEKQQVSTMVMAPQSFKDGTPRLTQSATQTDISIKDKHSSRNHSRNAKKVRSTSLSSSHKRPVMQCSEKRYVKQNLSKAPVERSTDPTTHLQELISGVISEVSDLHKSMSDVPAEKTKVSGKKRGTKMEKQNSKKMSVSSSNVAKICKPERSSLMEKHNTKRMPVSSSQSDLTKLATNSRKSKLERRVKRSRSESLGRATKKEPFRI